jgi:transposase
MAGILYRLRTGCQWKALPNDFGSGSTCHLRFQKWVELGVFAAIHRELISASTRDTTTRTLLPRCGFEGFDHTSDVGASNRSSARYAANRDAGSSSARTPGTTDSVVFSSGGKGEVLTTSRCFNSPAA